MGSKLNFTVKCLLGNKLRFILTVISIAVGVTSVLTVNSVSTFGAKTVSAELDSLGMNGLIVAPENDGTQLKREETEILSQIDGVSVTAPVTVNTSKVSADSVDSTALVWGIDEKAKEVVRFELMYGRLIDKSDTIQKRKVCILEESLAASIFGNENAVGRHVDLMNSPHSESFEVIGIVKTGKGIMQSVMGNYFPAFLYMPYTVISESPNFSQVFVKVNSDADTASLIERIKTRLSASASGNFAVKDLAGQKKSFESMLSAVTNVLTIIGAVSLIVAGISIMNIMLISVNERIKEIGIKKSIGATSFDILLDFLAESVIISIIGTLTGIISAIIIMKVCSSIFGIDITVSAGSVFGSVLLAVLLGSIFGIVPAYRASRYKPVEALRR